MLTAVRRLCGHCAIGPRGDAAGAAGELGCGGNVNKPFSIDTVTDAIRSAIAKNGMPPRERTYRNPDHLRSVLRTE